MAPSEIASPFGWVETSRAALRRLQRDLEEKGQGVTDEMGLLAIHNAYANDFFPGTSVLHTRPRYVFFICWNLLTLATRKSVGPANVLRAKDDADRWLTRQLVTSLDRARPAEATVDMTGILGVRLYRDNPEKLPAQRADFTYWTALEKWGFIRFPIASDRRGLYRRWGYGRIVRTDDAMGPDDDEVVREPPVAELRVAQPPKGWLHEDGLEHLTFDLTGEEARWLRDRLVSLLRPTGGLSLLAKAAELCEVLRPDAKSDGGPWSDPLVLESAKRIGELPKLERARQAATLAHYVRAIYAALVEQRVEQGSPSSTQRAYRDGLVALCADRAARERAMSLDLTRLTEDAPRVAPRLIRALERVQAALRAVSEGHDVERAVLDEAMLGAFEAVERARKGTRARLPRTEAGAARRVGFGPDTLAVYGLDYRWPTVRTMLADLHAGLQKS